ncbi:hypothetical protein KEM60_02348 [Austwickia sp. TVS 96-490-7B]|nr:hypothetical protein [Austwickia sp. TVS 96-490-7B]
MSDVLAYQELPTMDIDETEAAWSILSIWCS